MCVHYILLVFCGEILFKNEWKSLIFVRVYLIPKFLKSREVKMKNSQVEMIKWWD